MLPRPGPGTQPVTSWAHKSLVKAGKPTHRAESETISHPSQCHDRDSDLLFPDACPDVRHGRPHAGLAVATLCVIPSANPSASPGSVHG